MATTTEKMGVIKNAEYKNAILSIFLMKQNAALRPYRANNKHTNKKIRLFHSDNTFLKM